MDSVWLKGEEVRKRLDRAYGYGTEARTLVVEQIGNTGARTVRLVEYAIVSKLLASKMVRCFGPGSLLWGIRV